MKKILFFIFILIQSCFLFSQGQIERELLDSIANSNKHDYININIYFYNKEDISKLNDDLCKKQASFDERVKKTSEFQKNNLSFSKEFFYNKLNTIIGKNKIEKIIKDEKDFWVVNMLNANVRADFITSLIRIENIKSIDINSKRYKSIKAVKTEKSEARTSKSLGGTEWGLLKIKADKLWALGYTGRNTLFMSVDTGVEVEHPAIAENYAGNYLPQNQCWYGIRHEVPFEYSDHGTHTTGTILGLDRNTNDTIGVAFNAKFIASDPIASTNEDLLHPSAILDVYQWALNPDGNIETTSDVPRAINNSWGFAHSDLNYIGGFDPCAIPESDVLVTLETAGICVPFSAGNSGPNDTTLGYPAVKVYNNLNPMAIGAINSSEVIASFSSRGPSPDTCFAIPITPELKIRPEVVAPGVNVRSCVGKNDYANYQGTSMACPHVVGALLLLAEAFPNASAYDLKNALYQTSIDLGDEGEDNTYGNGLIDLEAAFEFLSQSYTITEPIQNNYDLATKILLNNKYTCLSNLDNIDAIVTNLGNNPIQNFIIKLYINNNLIDSTLISQTLLTNEEYHYSYNIDANILSQENINNIYITANPVETINEYDIFNNGSAVNIKLISESTFPYYIDFQDVNNISELSYYIENEDASNTWELLTWGTNHEHNAIGVVFKGYYNVGAIDRIYFPEIEIPDSEDTVFLTIKYAYKDLGSITLNDSLFIDISDNCGDSFTNIYKNGGRTLSTMSASGTALYNPTENDFTILKFDISNYKNSKIIFRLSTKNDKSTEIYIDSIAISNKGNESAVKEYIENKIKVYPNPFYNIINIEQELENETIEIYDNAGKLIEKKNIKYNQKIDCSSYPNGTYNIKFIKQNTIIKIIKN